MIIVFKNQTESAESQAFTLQPGSYYVMAEGWTGGRSIDKQFRDFEGVWHSLDNFADSIGKFRQGSIVEVIEVFTPTTFRVVLDPLVGITQKSANLNVSICEVPAT